MLLVILCPLGSDALPSPRTFMVDLPFLGKAPRAPFPLGDLPFHLLLLLSRRHGLRRIFLLPLAISTWGFPSSRCLALRPCCWLLCRLRPRGAFSERFLFCSSYPPGQWWPVLHPWLRLFLFLPVSFAAQLILPWHLRPRADLPGPFLDGVCPKRCPALSFRLAFRTPAPAATRTLILSVFPVVQLVLHQRLGPRAGLPGPFLDGVCPKRHPALSFRLAFRTPAPAATPVLVFSMFSVVQLVLLHRLGPRAGLTGPFLDGVCPKRHPALSFRLAFRTPAPAATPILLFFPLRPSWLRLLAPGVGSVASFLDGVCLERLPELST